ncbi:gamma-glutamylaminecyclotransferase B [Nothobranchius furzeri]|uniref:gamma-glutamylaminecyclotransferase B n=1 Tax=Nothobranchius furzeri TaxID=105023 RepID=UPI00077D4AE8|nr:gamma-glutamylaminecyclotransferase B [Nothobranchius furzeri]
MARVLFYGTLKKGQPNYHHVLNRNNGNAEFLATAITTQRYPLVIATKDNIPFLLNLPGQGQRVHGELYQVDEKMLKYLDIFESVPNLYQRTVEEVEITEWVGKEEEKPPGCTIDAFVYSTTTYQPSWLSLPTYKSYDSYGDHGLTYVCEED